MANIGTSFSKFAEVSNTVTSNTTAYYGIWLKRERYTTYDRVYFELRFWATNPYGDYFAWSQEGTMNWSFSFGGKSKSGSFSSISITANQTPVTKASGYVDIEHTAAYTGTASATAVLYKANKSCSASATLPIIASKSEVSVGGPVDLDSTATITCSNNTSGVTHTINVKTQGTSPETVETFTNVGSSKAWTPALFNDNTPSRYAELITSASRVFDVQCLTYYNGTYIGEDTCTVTLKVPKQSNTRPTLQGGEFDPSELNTSIPQAWISAGIYVQSKSRLSWYVEAKTKASAGMGSASVNIDGTTYRAASSNQVDATVVMTKAIQTAEALEVRANVSDTRNFMEYDSEDASTWRLMDTINVIKYITPSFDGEPQISRVNANGNPDDLGTYLAFTLKARISAVTKSNTHYNAPTFKIKWKQKSASTWNETTYTGALDTTNDDWVVNISNQKLQQNGSDVTISASSAYDIRFELIDQFNDSSHPVYSAADINVGGDLLNFNVNGHALAIGQLSTAAQNEEKLEVAYPTSFKTMPMINGVSLLEFIYPVGSIYLSANSTNPGTIFGGTWEQITGRFLYAAGNFGLTEFQGNTTQSHVLKLSEIPSHNHGADGGATISGGGHNHNAYFKEHYVPKSGYRDGSNDYARKSSASHDTSGQVTTSTGTHSHTLTAQGGGGGHTHDIARVNMFVWRRTA